MEDRRADTSVPVTRLTAARSPTRSTSREQMRTVPIRSLALQVLAATLLLSGRPGAVALSADSAMHGPPSGPGGDQGAPLGSGDFAPDQVVIKMVEGRSVEDLSSLMATPGVSVLSTLDALDVTMLEVPPGQVLPLIATLREDPAVRWAEPNYVVTIADAIPNDPEWGVQYGLRAIRAPAGWDFARGSSTVAVAVVDTGVDPTHPDLSGKLVPGYDFVNGDPDPTDDHGHGTHVAGMIGAATDNGLGIAGTSWGARIIPVKVLSSSGQGWDTTVASGMVWAVDQGARVINLSLGQTSPSSLLQSAVSYAVTHGGVVVAAAGNSGSSGILYPARYAEAIAVAATDQTNARASFSSYGPGCPRRFHPQHLSRKQLLHEERYVDGHCLRLRACRDHRRCAAPVFASLGEIRPGRVSAGLGGCRPGRRVWIRAHPSGHGRPVGPSRPGVCRRPVGPLGSRIDSCAV